MDINDILTDSDSDFHFLVDHIRNISQARKRPGDDFVQEENEDFYNTEDEEDDDETGIEYGEEEVAPEDDFRQSEEADMLMNDYFFGEDNHPGLQMPYSPNAFTSASFKSNGTEEGLASNASTVLNGLSQFVPGVTVTSGRRSKEENESVGGVKNSFHLTGEAIDLRPSKDLNKFLTSKEGRAFITSQGYEIVDERNRKGHGAHWHLEPAGTKQAGGVAIANTKEEQYVGLNDDNLEELVLPLDGMNPIRGLDSGVPVFVVDETGNSKVLRGPRDVAQMKGKVYEKKIKRS